MIYQLMIGALGLGQIMSWGILFYTFPLLSGPIGTSLGADKDAVYLAATIALLASGLAAYPVGTAIDRGHGRKILIGGPLLGGTLMITLGYVSGTSQLYWVFAGIGIAMAMSLYEPAFALLAQRLGTRARAGITALTLWGGFAGTVFVPFTQFLLDRLDWRETTIVLGLLHLSLGTALNLYAARPAAAPTPPLETRDKPATGWPILRWALARRAFWGLVITNVFYAATYIALTYHLYPLLIERGFDAADAVAGFAIIGPAQVAGRVLVWLAGRDRPIRQIGCAIVLLFPLAFALAAWMPAEFIWLAAFAVLLGVANGIMTIVRGLAVPELLSREGYGTLNGAISLPATITRGASPLLAAYLWSLTGSYDLALNLGIIGTVVMAAGFWLAAWRRK